MKTNNFFFIYENNIRDKLFDFKFDVKEMNIVYKKNSIAYGSGVNKNNNYNHKANKKEIGYSSFENADNNLKTNENNNLSKTSSKRNLSKEKNENSNDSFGKGNQSANLNLQDFETETNQKETNEGSRGKKEENNISHNDSGKFSV